MATAPLDLVEEEEAPTPASPLAFIAQLALTDGDVSGILDDTELAKIGADVRRDYDNDLSDRKEWEDVARRALDRAAQEEIKRPHDAPPYRRSYVNYPILTTAAQQFNARAYPAICKSGSMVKVKVIGSDRGRPEVGQDGQPVMQPAGPADPNTGQVQMLPVWAIPPGAKQKRADRVADYLNVYLEFRMEGWEADTDRLLYEMPIVGCGFRKLRWADGLQQASYVSALDLVVPNGARSLADSPRATEKLNDVWPFQIRQRMASGEYRRTDLDGLTDEEEKPRLLLEQHRLLDLDGDGIDEPYVVTVDHETSRVLRLIADFDQDDVVLGEDDQLAMIRRRVHYVKYPFLPHPKGHFYDIGFGHLLEPLNDVANTAINQMFDAGHAQIAGGGFIAAGIRLQGSNRSESMRWQPGEYKVVNASGGDIRSGIIERTFPQPSVIMFNLLELILGAAKDITSVKDIVTGNAPNTAPVGTTLALIEQGLQVFTAIYKRVYRALGEEFALIRDNLVMFGGEEVAEDYLAVLDDPEADFASDFADTDTDIKPVADPSSVTKMQQMAKAQFLLGMRGVGLNDMEINRRVLEAAGIDDIDQLMPQQQAPDPLAIAKLAESQSQTELNQARGQQAQATALKTVTEVGHSLGESDGYAGRVPDVAGPSGNPLDGAGVPAAGAGGEGNMGGGVVGPGGF